MSTIQPPDFLSVATAIKNDARRYAKVYCLQWFDDSFQKQGFTDTAFEAWNKRKTPDRRPGGAILIDTAFLRRSLAVLNEDENKLQFGTHVPYAAIHNNGGRVRATQNVRGHHRVRNGTREQVRPFTRRINTNYPQRKFIGKSELMMKELDKWVLNEIQKRFNQL